jgi:hypothetical protein
VTTVVSDAFLYSEPDYEAIAAAIDLDAIDTKAVAAYASRFDAAARTLFDPPDYFELVPDEAVIKKLDSIEKTAEKVIRYTAALILARGDRLPNNLRLDVDNLPRFQSARFRHQIEKLIELFAVDEYDLEDGMPNSPIVSALLRETPQGDRAKLERSEDEFVIRDLLLTIKLGGKDPCVVLLAARDLAARAKEAHEAVLNVRNLTLPSVNSGDLAFNAWIDEMLNLYKAITGLPVKTAVGKPGWENEGIAYGRVIEFLKAAIRPFEHALLEKGILAQQLAEDAWRSRIRTADRARTKYAGNLAIRQKKA